MTVRGLNRAQLKKLKTKYYVERHPEDVDYGKLADIDNLVKDSEIIEAYEGVDFVEEDFYTDKTPPGGIFFL